RDLLAELGRIRARDGGTLYLTTSRRTRPEVAAAVDAALPEGAVLYRWSAETAADNPYLAMLALADRFVVTGDSVSMMV
ncbi:ELM1/GtrOC1 family putative glycosyltransferase, partial [Stenotrophomonas maltophilia]|uniref:ELM1/GtrOC1 family putative glycosyltransferase n=1 Tax=Stenotrophomonas maltophilia TaxID=40324 RepID=UPI001954EA0D